MYVKSITIDGFKTYGNKVELVNFDPQFNAITGPNGSGKSNLLDAICFVLGMQSARQMRGGNFHELIYNKGTSGVTKAVVTIVFDNRDTERSPPAFKGMKEFAISRQILSVGGIKCSYLINGKSAQNKEVTDVFDSVHLNVNNPYFLVMQGRIREVIENSPTQNLGLIEEAIGTSVFNAKVVQVNRIVNRAVSRLNEVQQLLEVSGRPLVEKIAHERRQFNNLKRLEGEHAKAENLHMAFIYKRVEKAKSEESEKLRIVDNDKTNINQEISRTKDKITNLEAEIQRKNEMLNMEGESGVQKITDLIKKAQDEESNSSVRLNSLMEKKATESTKIKDAETIIQRLTNSIKEEEKSLQKSEELKHEVEKYTKEYKKAEERFRLARSGQHVDSVSDEAGETLADQQVELGRKLTEISLNKENFTKQLNESLQKLPQNEIKLKEVERLFARNEEIMNKHQHAIASLRAEISRLNYSNEKFGKLDDDIEGLHTTKMQIENKLSQHRYRWCSFKYKCDSVGPEHIFGIVGLLVNSIDEKYNVALQAIAGGRKANVIIDKSSIGAYLVKHGQLEYRTTFCPLDKASGRVIASSVLDKARRLVGEDNVDVAISLVTYDQRYQKVMEQIFGSYLICATRDIAFRLAYNPQIFATCVSLSGDVVHPQGEQSGGYTRTEECFLNIAREFLQDSENLKQIKRLTEEAEKTKRELLIDERRYRDLDGRIKVEQTKLDDVVTFCNKDKDKLSQLRAENAALKENKINLPKEIEKLNAMEEECEAKLEEIAHKISQSNSSHPELVAQREKEMKDMEKKLQQAKDKRATVMNYETMLQHIDKIKTNIQSKKNEIKNSEEELQNLQAEYEELMQDHKQKQEAVRKLEEEKRKVVESISNQNEEVQKLNKKMNNYKSNLEMLEFKLKQYEQTATEHAQKIETFNAKLQEFDQRYSWIEQERSKFGVPNGLYDFRSYNAERAKSDIQKMAENIEELRRNTNITLKDLHGNEEQDYNDYKTKLENCHRYVSKIFNFIKHLDELKRRSLLEARDKINGLFGSIFNNMLPGSNAKLELLPQKTIIDGLEIKVCVSNVWKKNLTELSGGQKSLVALSLILSISKFHPSPIYILDEVDAALDLSHTQNMGKMIHTHFKNSQFIIVSLKEGMFNNANALFRTELRNGMTRVNRIK